MREIQSRREANTQRLNGLRQRLCAAEGELESRACVYLTGSFARGEASDHSDLDLFIVAGDSGRLPGLDEILLKADLIRAARDCGFPDFSGDGEYLAQHTVEGLVTSLGKPEDDADNTFTARLLLLLESRPLLGRSVYTEIIRRVVDAYWRDFDDHRDDFRPAFLANDILRLWRTLCVNYEARTQTDPPARKAKRKLKNYKLKHSRLLTCYSALLFLLDSHQRSGTVRPEDVVQMADLTPTQRLETLADRSGPGPVSDRVAAVLRMYETFLISTGKPEPELIQEFTERDQAREYQRLANEFGDVVADLMSEIGCDSPLLRLYLV